MATGQDPGAPSPTSVAGVVARWGGRCTWCSATFGRRVRATREHLLPRVKGGPTWPENLVPACARCNRERGTASAVQWLDEVRQRGRRPRTAVVEASLLAVRDRIRREGGARRIRPALAAELRKLGHDPTT